MTPLSVPEMRSLLAAAPRRGRGRFYSPELIQQALQLVDQEKARGVKLPHIAEALGVPLSALFRWQQLGAPSKQSDSLSTFLPLRVSAEGSSIVVHGPGALRIEGLEVSSLALLLRSLL